MRNRRHLIGVLALTGILGSSLVACSSTAAADTADAPGTTFRTNDWNPPAHPFNADGWEPFGAALAEATDGAVGGQGIPLDTRHSIAIDRRIHAYGTPFYITGELPTGAEGAVEPFHRLTIAQDTGSAIVGPARADIFFGAGAEAGSISGRIQHPGTFVILLPRALDPARRKVPRPPMKPEMAGPALLTETP